eukprot:285535_1
MLCQRWWPWCLTVAALTSRVDLTGVQVLRHGGTDEVITLTHATNVLADLALAALELDGTHLLLDVTETLTADDGGSAVSELAAGTERARDLVGDSGLGALGGEGLGGGGAGTLLATPGHGLTAVLATGTGVEAIGGNGLLPGAANAGITHGTLHLLDGDLVADEADRVHGGAGHLPSSLLLALGDLLLGHTLLLLGLELHQLDVLVGVDEIGDVLTLHDLGHDIVLPVVVLQVPVLALIVLADTAATVALLQNRLGDALEALLGGEVLVVDDLSGDVGGALHTIPSNGLGAVETVLDHLEAASALLLLGPLLQEHIAGEGLEVTDGDVGQGGGGDPLGVGLLDGLHDHIVLLGAEVLQGGQVGLVEDHNQRLAGEQGADGLEEVHLLVEGVPAGLAKVHEEEDGGADVSQRGDGLHLDHVTLIQGVVQDTRGVDDLPGLVLVV